MDYSQTLTNWVSRLSEGDPNAMEHVFARYFDQLVSLAVRKMHGLNQANRSGEDIALSAIKSLYLGLKDARIQLRTEDDLWGCLFCLTVRKSVAQRRREFARKRSTGKKMLSGNEMISDDDGCELFDYVAGKEPSPELAAQMAENADELLALFDENSTQHEIVALKLQGLTVAEIAERVGLISRTVFWHLEKIRSRWEFFKGMEYLSENLLQGMSVKKAAAALEKSEELIEKLMNCVLTFWKELSSENECRLLKMTWEQPDDFEALLEKRDPDAAALESRLGKIAGRWQVLSRTEWRNDLGKIWSGKR